MTLETFKHRRHWEIRDAPILETKRKTTKHIAELPLRLADKVAVEVVLWTVILMETLQNLSPEI